MIRKLGFCLAVHSLAASPVAASPATGGSVHVEWQGLRSHKGVVRLCLTANKRYFPDCSKDPASVRLSVPAQQPAAELPAIAPGRYALSLLHDENDNGRLDTFAAIPREGFGFSRNPAIRFGPPRFTDTLFSVGSDAVSQTIRVRYLL